MSSLWRRAASLAKDKGSFYLAKIPTAGGVGSNHHRRQDIEAAIILATSHDDRSLDYKSAGQVFAWARASPSEMLSPIMWCLARRVANTRSWVVALKCLILAHGLLLCSDNANPAVALGRLPFNLSDFQDRRSSTFSGGFSTFIRAYFRFIDQRSLFASLKLPPLSPKTDSPVAVADDLDSELENVERLQILLDLLIQVRPYGDGMDVELVLEAMDCVVTEVFEVYSGICKGIAHFLVAILGTDREVSNDEEARQRRGPMAVKILRRASKQSKLLSGYFDLCRSLGVLSDVEFPVVEHVPDEDVDELERLIIEGVNGDDSKAREEEKEGKVGRELVVVSKTVMSNKWVVFEDGDYSTNPFLVSPKRSPASSRWTLAVNSGIGEAPMNNGNLIELI